MQIVQVEAPKVDAAPPAASTLDEMKRVSINALHILAPANDAGVLSAPVVDDGAFGAGALALCPDGDPLSPADEALMGRLMGVVDALRALSRELPWADADADTDDDDDDDDETGSPRRRGLDATPPQHLDGLADASARRAHRRKSTELLPLDKSSEQTVRRDSVLAAKAAEAKKPSPDKLRKEVAAARDDGG